MAELKFHPCTQSVSFSFRCPSCGQESQSESLPVPLANFTADTQSESENSECYDVCCEHCGKSINVEIFNGMYGGTILIEELEQQDAFELVEETDEQDTDENYE